MPDLARGVMFRMADSCCRATRPSERTPETPCHLRMAALFQAQDAFTTVPIIAALSTSMRSMSTFHFLARAVAIQGDSILLVRAKGASNTFLPGGHIEFAETAHGALKRELFEEMGCDIEVGEFLGAIEHVWPDSSRENHEINLLFSVSISSSLEGSSPLSKERHLDVFWAKLSELEDYNLQPRPAIDLINRRCAWGSTLDDHANCC